MLYYTLYHASKHVPLARSSTPLPLSSLTKLFIHSFTALSSRLEILQHIASTLIKPFLKSTQTASLQDLLKADNSYLFTNLFSRFKQPGTPLHQQLSLLRSFQAHAPEVLVPVMHELIETVSAKIDRCIAFRDQDGMLKVIEMARSLSLVV
jgi:hypothetical protein